MFLSVQHYYTFTMSSITVYTTPSCPYCTQLKNWLEEEGIEYEDYNVAENKQKAKEMMQKTGQRGVPQTIIEKEEEEEAVIGFQPEKIKKLKET